MDVNLTISLMRGQMGAVIEKAVNVAVETVLGEMIRVVGLKFEEIKREMTAKEKENENIKRMLETSRSQMKTMRKYITILSAKDHNRLYQGDGDVTPSAGVHCRRGPTSTVSVCTKAPNPCTRPRVTEPAPVPSWVRQQVHMSKAPNVVQEPVRNENHMGDRHFEEIHGSLVHKVNHSSHQLVDSQGLLSETSDPIWGQNPLTSAETEHTDLPDTSLLSASMMTDEPSQTTTTVTFGAPSLKIKQEEAEVEIISVKDEPSAVSIPTFEYSNHELHQQPGEPELEIPLDLPGSFQALQSPSTSAEFTIPAFIGVNPSTSVSDVRELSPWSLETNPAVERAILKLQGEMGIKISHLTALVQSLLENRCLVPSPQIEDDEEDYVLPLRSMEDLDTLEQKLGDRGKMQKLVNRLSVSGGQTMKKTISRICNKVFATNVAKQLNWCGRGDKRGLRKTNIGVVIIDDDSQLSVAGAQKQVRPRRKDLNLFEEFKRSRTQLRGRNTNRGLNANRRRELEQTLPQALLADLVRERREKTRLRVARWRAKRKLQACLMASQAAQFSGGPVQGAPAQRGALISARRRGGATGQRGGHAFRRGISETGTYNLLVQLGPSSSQSHGFSEDHMQPGSTTQHRTSGSGSAYQ